MVSKTTGNLEVIEEKQRSSSFFQPTIRPSAFFQIGYTYYPRLHHTATLLKNGMVLIAAGDYCSDIAELYDPASGTFNTTAANVNVARTNHTATLLAYGRVLIAGGSGNTILASAEIYDPTEQIFLPTANLNTARQLHTATQLNNGSVLIAGGLNK